MTCINFNPSYVGKRDDILRLVPPSARRICDIGCSIGTLGEQIKLRDKNVKVTGVEIDQDMAKLASQKLDQVIIGDIEKINFLDYFSSGYFDCIILADILEHLKDGWEILARIVNLLADNGIVIASIPNIRHYSTIFNLVFRGIWPYRERGIHDRNHLRFFTLKNINQMFQDAGLKIIKVVRKYRIIEKPHRYNRFSGYFACLLPKDFITFQYLIVARNNRPKNPLISQT